MAQAAAPPPPVAPFQPHEPFSTVQETPVLPSNATKHDEVVPEPQKETVLAPRRRLWLFSMPRTSSNMFLKMMSGQENMSNVDYEILDAFWPTLDSYDLDKVSEERQLEVKAIFQKCFSSMVTRVKDSEENDGKTVFAKEHAVVCFDRKLIYDKFMKNTESPAYNPNASILEDWAMTMPGESELRTRTNPTMFPDEYLLAWNPVFLIRHPALMIPSAVRAFGKMIDNPITSPAHNLAYSFAWSRMLYDWYAANKAPTGEKREDAWPVVLDADDIVRGKGAINKFCAAAEFDPEAVLYSWESKSNEEIDQSGLTGVFRGTLMASSGIRTELHDNAIDISSEFEKWRTEFGETDAQLLRERVEATMDDYEYLRSKRVEND